MSGPYDNQYNQGYQQGYPQQGQYDQSQQYGQQYGQGPQYGQGAQYGQPEPGFGPPARQDSFGPPVHGGFQHGQQGGQFGQYDASNPQGYPGYYDQNRGYDQNQQYQQQPQHHDQGYPQQQGQQGQQGPNAPYDPNAPEGERGLGGALAGGAAGMFLGKKTGHGFLGTVGGAIMGSLAQDKFKDSHGKHGGKHSHHGKSSWGGY